MARRDKNRSAPLAPPGIDGCAVAGTTADGHERAKNPLALEIEALEQKSLDELRAAWRQRLKSEPPRVKAREFLLRLLTWNLQAARYGGLGPDTQRRLKRLAREQASAPDRKLRTPVRVQAGARLIREWKGVRHAVDVVIGGYVWEGKNYKTLSMIARAITGTNWSGPRFFGVEDVAETKRPTRP